MVLQRVQEIVVNRKFHRVNSNSINLSVYYETSWKNNFYNFFFRKIFKIKTSDRKINPSWKFPSCSDSCSCSDMTVATGRHARCQSRDIRTSGARNQKFKGFWRQIFKATFNPYQQHLAKCFNSLQSHNSRQSVASPKSGEVQEKMQTFLPRIKMSSKMTSVVLLSLPRSKGRLWLATSNNLFSRMPRLRWLLPRAGWRSGLGQAEDSLRRLWTERSTSKNWRRTPCLRITE